MTNNPTGFKITDEAAGWNRADFDDVFVRKDCFLEGGLWLWGAGTNGRLGDNTMINRSSPVQTISGGTNWRTVDGGRDAVAATKTDGTLWTWGSGGNGRLGNNAVINISSPVQTISGGTNWRSVNAGYYHPSAIKTDGTLWNWGRGNCGQLGDDTVIDRSSPVQTISGGTNWRTVDGGRAHTAATKTDGTLWIWGRGAEGQLGNNAAVSTSSPVQTISGGTNWKNVSAGDDHTAAIKTDGTLWTWGSGGNGQLGNNAVINISSPVQTISGGTNWRSVSVGRVHTASTKTDGTLWSWGYGGRGQLGNNAVTSTSSPIQTISGGTNWRTVSASFNHIASTKTDGTLWLWGSGNDSQLGNNDITNRSSPVQTISGGTNWRSVSAGSFHTISIREDCW